MQTVERSECGWLYGDKAAAAQFDRLASLGWRVFLGTRDGKAQYAPTAENDTDRWLAVVYQQLQHDLTVGPNYFQEHDCMVFRLAEGMERIEEAENYALPMTYGPLRDPDDRPAPDGPFDRWRITELTADVFAASAAALDVLLSDHDPAGNRVISLEEMDAYQRSPAFQEANWLIDMIRLAHGRTFSVCRHDGKPSSRALPSICPKAEPKPPVELRPDGEMLAMIEACYRSLHLIGDDQSLHWVGREQTPETTCTCDLMARPDASRSAEWHNLWQMRQAVVALFILLHKCAVGRYRTQQFRKAGAVVSEQSAPDVQPFDRLEQRIAATATAAGVALPDGAPIVPNWVRSPDGLPQSEEWERWESDWRAVRVAVETRLAALDSSPLPCPAPTVLRVDTREVPMEAPANTPAPLRETFNAVARALFQAAEMRRCPPTARLIFEQQARSLSDAYRTARGHYATAELYLRAVADDDGRCAFQDALSAVCRVNDAAGDVMLNTVPFHRGTAHILAVPTFDLAGLLRGMLRQTARAALQLRSVVRETDADPSTSAAGDSASTQQSDLPPTHQPSPPVPAGAVANPPPLVPGSGDRREKEALPPRRPLKEPSKDEFTVYKYSFATGKTQKELADDPALMDLLGRKVDQGTISRWLGKVKKWVEALGLPPDLSEPLGSKPTPMDPGEIDLGKRQDGRAKRQRGRRNSDSDG
jgi:hypothetical protein